MRSGPNDFKVYRRVYPNGHGNGAGTHLSVFMKLMSGENDDNLVWPLRATFTVTLLNLIRDKNHKIAILTIDGKLNWGKISGNSTVPPWRCYQTFAVTDRSHVFTIDEKHNKCKVLGDSPGSGIGYTTFAALSELNLDEAKQCHYLNDDSFYFSI